MPVSLKQVISKLPLEQQKEIKRRTKEVLKEYMSDTRAKVSIKSHTKDLGIGRINEIRTSTVDGKLCHIVIYDDKELEFELHPIDKKHYNKGNNAFWYEYIG
jgi:hypothetical protein